MAVDTPGLVEREHELETLERLLQATRDGAGGLLLIEGPPGIGKSSLLAAASASAGDMRVLSARGGEFERELPFGVARQLLEQEVAASEGAEREALLTGAAALARPVLLAIEPDQGVEPSFSALHGLYWLTVNLADSRPLLLLVDDAHWADLASLRWLAYLARRLEGVPVALIAAARTTEAGPGQELLDELASLTDLGVLHPGGLSEQAVARLLEERFGEEADAEFVAACHHACTGNPFLLRELIGELSRRSIEPRSKNATLASRLSSSGVGRAVRARLRQLDPACTALARVLAVLGDGADASLAAGVADLDPDVAARAADALVDAAILAPGPGLAFLHPLVRSSIYADLSASERATEHERAAKVLAALGASPDRIAVHLLATRPDSDPRAVETRRRAANEATGRGAPDAAIAYLVRALEEPLPSEMRATIAYELGVAALRAGIVETAIERLHEATQATTDARGRALAANALASALFLADRSDEAMAELTGVIDVLPESEREQGLRLQATRWVAPRVSTMAWRRLLEAGDRFTLAGRSANTPGERLTLAVAGLHAVRRRTAAEARELAWGALADGALLKDPGPESAGFWIAPLVLLWADALEEANHVTSEVIEWAGRHGSLPAFSMAAQVRAFVAWRRGALADAEADAGSALEHAVPGFSPFGHFALANVLLARGKLTEADELLSGPPFEPGSSSRSIFSYLQTRARLRVAQQRPHEALEDLFACGRFEEEWAIETPAVCTWRADAALLLASLDDRDDGLRLAREELERCRAFGAPSSLGAALRALGALEDGVKGQTLLDEAVGVLEASPCRLEHAQALLELGAATRRAGRRADAREPLRQALELARECGADAVAARAHAELVAAGARPRRDPTESRAHLTASELRVARLAAEGMTNREIAQALFLTENTIGTHMRSVFRKLDISSRSQIARAL